MGVGQSVAFPASARTVANWFPDTQRGLVNSSYLIGVRLGQALVNAAGVGLIALYGWRMFFVISGLAPLLWIVPWMMALRRWETPARPACATASGSNRFTFASSFGLLRHPTVLGTFLGFFAFDYVWFVFVYWLPGYLRLERHFTPAQMAFYGVRAVPGDVYRHRAVGHRHRSTHCRRFSRVARAQDVHRDRLRDRARHRAGRPGRTTTARRSGCC